MLSIRNLVKLRAADGTAGYRLVVPRLDIRPGEKILITGPSGSGKSTFLDLLGMVLKPDSAEQFHYAPDRDIAEAWRAGRLEALAAWRRNVGYVLQTGGLLPFLSVRENINVPRRLLGLPDDGFIDELARDLGIAHLLDKAPSRLSVGERQRAAIARAMAARPPLILADEPTAALDPFNAKAVLSLFTDMVSRLGTTLVLVTHQPAQMAGMGFRRLEVRQNPVSEWEREAVLGESA